MKKVLQIISRYLLVVLFLYYHIGNTAFVHTHVVHNHIITHSHPFLPGAHHGHQGGELETIAWLNAAVEFFTPLAFFACLWLFLRSVLTAVKKSLFYITDTVCSSRAPPCIL
jgi:hypothetical protein